MTPPRPDSAVVIIVVLNKNQFPWCFLYRAPCSGVNSHFAFLYIVHLLLKCFVGLIVDSLSGYCNIHNIVKNNSTMKENRLVIASLFRSQARCGIGIDVNDYRLSSNKKSTKLDICRIFVLKSYPGL